MVHPRLLRELIEEALDTYKFPEDGKGFIPLPKEATAIVSPGVAKRNRLRDSNSVIREHRGRKDVYINRASLPHGSLADKVSVVIYTKDGYIQDAAKGYRASSAAKLGVDTASSSEMLARYLDVFVDGLKKELADIDYMWVTTIASIGPEDPPVSPYRLTSNLADEGYVESDDASAILNKFIDQAADSADYWDEWVTVAAPKMD